MDTPPRPSDAPRAAALYAIPLTFALALFVLLGSSIAVERQEAATAQAIDVAGGQGMLIAQYTVNAMYASRRGSADLEALVDTFERSRAALMSGGALEHSGRELTLPAAPTPDIHSLLVLSGERMRALEKAAAAFLALTPDDRDYDRAMAAMESASAAALAASAAVVAGLVSHSDSQVYQTIRMQLVGGVLILLVGLLATGRVYRTNQQFQEMSQQRQQAELDSAALLQTIRDDIAALLEVTERAAGGDLTAQIDVVTDADMGRMAEGLRAMIQSLNVLVSRVQKSGDKAVSATNQIAEGSRDQEATIAEQAATTREILASVRAIAATAGALRETTQRVVGITEETHELAERGQVGLEQMRLTMDGMRRTSGSVGSRLEFLDEKAASIKGVVTAITKVADQTNLLSLNAAIEAEKAGEHGRGFAVVAEEIRRLADRTATATIDIEQTVAEIQQAVSTNSESMERLTREVVQGAAAVDDVVAQLQQIIDRVQSLSPTFGELAHNVDSQASAAEQIHDAMRQLSLVVSEAAESQRQSNDSIRSLNEVAEELQAGVSRFQVGR